MSLSIPDIILDNLSNNVEVDINKIDGELKKEFESSDKQIKKDYFNFTKSINKIMQKPNKVETIVLGRDDYRDKLGIYPDLNKEVLETKLNKLEEELNNKKFEKKSYESNNNPKEIIKEGYEVTLDKDVNIFGIESFKSGETITVTSTIDSVKNKTKIIYCESDNRTKTITLSEKIFIKYLSPDIDNKQDDYRYKIKEMELDISNLENKIQEISDKLNPNLEEATQEVVNETDSKISKIFSFLFRK